MRAELQLLSAALFCLLADLSLEGTIVKSTDSMPPIQFINAFYVHALTAFALFAMVNDEPNDYVYDK